MATTTFSDATGTPIVASWLNDVNSSVYTGKDFAGIFYTNVKDPTFGALGDGSTDDTLAIQAAFDAVRGHGGGVVYFPTGTYIVNKSIRIGSKTKVVGAGRSSVIKAKQSGYVGINGGSFATQNCQLFQNYNFSVSSLTDTDIIIEDLAFDWGSVTISGGGAHSIALRYVDRVRVYNVYSQYGENVTALQACRDTVVDSCHGYNCANCYFDHWDGSDSAHVTNCTGRNDNGVYIAQGIQFTGCDSYLANRNSVNIQVAFNRLYNVKSLTGQASAIISNLGAAGSTTSRFISFGNIVENGDYGLVFEGLGSHHLSMGDTFINVVSCPIFLTTNSTTPADCRVIDPHLIDCNHTVGNVALIDISGSNCIVKGVKVSNTGAAAYTLIGWIPVTATNSVLEIDHAPNGSGGLRFQIDSTTSKVVDNNYWSGRRYTTPTIASASTIAPVTPIVIVSGTTNVDTITVPPEILIQGGTLTIIPSGAFHTTTSGNIQIATTAVVGKTLTMTYEPGLAKWFPSY